MTSEPFFIIHNPKCSKSRAAMAILESKEVAPSVVEYMKGELTKELLERALKGLKRRPKDVLRTKEEEFKKLDLDLEDDAGVVEAILKHPGILERPIVVKGEEAVMGRPPENVLGLF